MHDLFKVIVKVWILKSSLRYLSTCIYSDFVFEKQHRMDLLLIVCDTVQCDIVKISLIRIL